MKLEGVINTTDPISEAELNAIFELKTKGTTKFKHQLRKQTKC